MTIIDSLKRLERAGAEDSTQTQKLLAAARELSEKVAPLFADYDGLLPRHYETLDGDLLGPDGTPVFTDRETALAFASDLASGLMDEFAAFLEMLTRKRRIDTENSIDLLNAEREALPDTLGLCEACAGAGRFDDCECSACNGTGRAREGFAFARSELQEMKGKGNA